MFSSWRKISQEEANDQSVRHAQEVDDARLQHRKRHVPVQPPAGALLTHPRAVESCVRRARVKQRAQLAAQIAQGKAQEVQPS